MVLCGLEFSVIVLVPRPCDLLCLLVHAWLVNIIVINVACIVIVFIAFLWCAVFL